MGEAGGIGIMGGTFDPVHYGHLVAAEEARVRFGLERVVFVPNGEPPHKKDYAVTAAEHRYQMTVLATSSNPAFEASRIEIDRAGVSYTVETLEQLQRQLVPRTRLCFITGADAVLEILTWRNPERLLRSCEFIAVTRPGHDLGYLQGMLSSELLARVHLLEAPGVHISSTELRRRAAAGESLRYLTPQAVVRYIAAHRLYSAGDAMARGCAQG